MRCPECDREVEITASEWTAVECPRCGAVWIGVAEDAFKVLVPTGTRKQ